MSITRQRLKELELKERKIDEIRSLLGAAKVSAKDEVEVVEDEPEVHFSSGKTAGYRQIPAKLLPANEKRGFLGLRKKKIPEFSDLEKIKEKILEPQSGSKFQKAALFKITEESPEIMFQQWLQKRCRRGCHLCEECVQEIERIINV
jgi:hypothetical protein